MLREAAIGWRLTEDVRALLYEAGLFFMRQLDIPDSLTKCFLVLH
jgi:hypothetical protein